MKKIIVKANEAGQRLDKLLLKYLNKAGKGFIYKMLRKKNITLNAKKALGSELLNLGDEVTLFLADETIDKFSEILVEKSRVSLDILYEDEHILLLNKPAGILSQKAKDTDHSIIEAIISYLIESKALEVEDLRSFKPSVCNRLDRNTSGLIIAGKSLIGLQEMSKVLKERRIDKYYYCVVTGVMKDACLIEGYLCKDEKTNQVAIYQEAIEDSMPIKTAYTPLSGNIKYTLLKVKLITGRTHQIRAHLASIGHPILGDSKYGNPKANQEAFQNYKIKYQMLHSGELIFPEFSGAFLHLSGMQVRAPLPKVFTDFLKGEHLPLWEHGIQGD